VLSVQWLEAPLRPDLGVVAGLVSDFWREVVPGEPDIEVDELVADVGESPVHRRVLMAAATEDGEVVGVSQLNLDDIDGRRSHGWLKYLVVRPDRRRRGLGDALLTAAIQRARRERRTRLDTFVCTAHPGGMAFASARGATAGLTNRQSRLRTDQLDRTLLEAWVAQASDRAGDYGLVCFDGLCPEQWLTGFAEVIAVMNTAPRSEGVDDVVVTSEQVRANEEAHLRRGGWGWTVCACHRPTGQLVGYTELGGSRYRPWLADQGDTAVHPAHRDRGLGRWMKAVNALRLVEERPEIGVIETWNAGVNGPMLAINDAMGFASVAEWQEWRLDITA
jgi:mycothiol synthase